MPDSIDSLDSTASSEYSYDDDEEEELRLAQQEWEESLEQLQQLVAVVLLPFLGKFLGRRWSHWGMSLAACCVHINPDLISPSFSIQRTLDISDLDSESRSSLERGHWYHRPNHTSILHYALEIICYR